MDGSPGNTPRPLTTKQVFWDTDFDSPIPNLKKNWHKQQDAEQDFLCRKLDKDLLNQSNGENNLLNGRRAYSCTSCEHRFSTIELLASHMGIHTGESEFTCPDCDFKGKNISKFKVHMAEHTGEYLYKCTSCDYITADIMHFELHSRMHPNVMPFSCSECKFRGRFHSDLKRHMHTSKHMIKHICKSKFACSECEALCKYGSNIKKIFM
ncbi:unnamed protein product [Meganyctiphanes norvegica]|uniref:C2H2-type domain-containing protein n=1 Tax=Meganyctiphanes norvegica TaxID=48144 RepID=A0AAV2QZN1_MEGNR